MPRSYGVGSEMSSSSVMRFSIAIFSTTACARWKLRRARSCCWSLKSGTGAGSRSSSASGPETTWTFLRHGQSRANLDRRLSDDPEVPLTPLGEAQARAAGAHLSHQRFALILVSSYLRARQTATLALGQWAAATGHQAPPWRPVPWLRERSFGALAGVDIDAVRADHRNTLITSWDQAAPGGEHYRALAARVVPSLARLRPEGDVLVVAHAGVIRLLLGLLDRTPLEELGFLKIANSVPLHRSLSPGAWTGALDHAGLGPPPSPAPTGG